MIHREWKRKYPWIALTSDGCDRARYQPCGVLDRRSEAMRRIHVLGRAAEKEPIMTIPGTGTDKVWLELDFRPRGSLQKPREFA